MSGEIWTMTTKKVLPQRNLYFSEKASRASNSWKVFRRKLFTKEERQTEKRVIVLWDNDDKKRFCLDDGILCASSILEHHGCYRGFSLLETSQSASAIVRQRLLRRTPSAFFIPCLGIKITPPFWVVLFLWRRERDSNPWDAINAYTISNRAPSTSSAISPFSRLKYYTTTFLKLQAFF